MGILIRYYSVFAGCLLLLLQGCTGLRYTEPGPNDEETLQTLHQALFDNPQNAEASRDLGAAYVRLQQPSTGLPYLEDALSLSSADPKTLFYLGLATEMEIGMEDALPYYAQYGGVSLTSPYRKMMKGRHQWITDELIRTEMRALLAGEASLEGQGIDSSAIAVFPLRFYGSDSSYAHLGRAFSELVVVDLSQVPGLTLVERVRIRELLDELSLTEQELTDPSVSPRIGRLLGAGHLTGGRLSLFNDEGLQVDFASWNPEQAVGPDFLRHGGRLAHFFDIEKEVVFALLRTLQIELTPEQRQRIEHIPTQNMQAFLAYSRGLSFEDRGFYIQATEAFQEATLLDPSFEAAQQAAERASDAAAGAGSAGRVIDAVNELEGEGGDAPGVDLIGLRMSILTGGGAGGSDERQPAAEAASAGDPILSDPPAPPSNQ